MMTNKQYRTTQWHFFEVLRCYGRTQKGLQTASRNIDGRQRAIANLYAEFEADVAHGRWVTALRRYDKLRNDMLNYTCEEFACTREYAFYRKRTSACLSLLSCLGGLVECRIDRKLRIKRPSKDSPYTSFYSCPSYYVMANNNMEQGMPQDFGLSVKCSPWDLKDASQIIEKPKYLLRKAAAKNKDPARTASKPEG